ncbi:DUF2268 domain-containing putative Zn-dependent protease [Ureibacillus chungkukjangi]|nr:DUF2268 domain-containing putative Zn-dependent protease [Ureibacillus chungkukjangi]
MVFLLLFTLTACTQAEKSKEELNTDDIEIMYTFENPQTKQKFKIIHANQLFERYIEETKGDPSNGTLEKYKEEVIQPIYKDCFKNAEYLYMAEDLLGDVPNRLTELEIISENLETRKIEINELIQESLLKSAELLPSQEEVAVCVLPSTHDVHMITVGAGKIIIPYNGYFSDDFIKVGVAHEYHHSFWTQKYLNNHFGTVLDNLIFEGKAVMFEKTVYPELESSTSVDLTYNKELWSKVEPDLNKQDLNRSLEIIIGGKDLPDLYGYSEGYKMVKSYLDLYPTLTPEEWTALTAQDIFEKGKYIEHYQ